MSTTKAAIDLPASVRSILDHKGKGRDFLSDKTLRNTSRQGADGFEIEVRLTSYRALPLSCIEGVRLKLDGKAIDSSSIVFSLNGYSHKLSELAGLSGVWWFILDNATLFVPHAPLPKGEHLVEGTLITVEPYVTAGRFSFYNSSSKRLTVA